LLEQHTVYTIYIYIYIEQVPFYSPNVDAVQTFYGCRIKF